MRINSNGNDLIQTGKRKEIPVRFVKRSELKHKSSDCFEKAAKPEEILPPDDDRTTPQENNSDEGEKAVKSEEILPPDDDGTTPQENNSDEGEKAVKPEEILLPDDDGTAPQENNADESGRGVHNLYFNQEKQSSFFVTEEQVKESGENSEDFPVLTAAQRFELVSKEASDIETMVEEVRGALKSVRSNIFFIAVKLAEMEENGRFKLFDPLATSMEDFAARQFGIGHTSFYNYKRLVPYCDEVVLEGRRRILPRPKKEYSHFKPSELYTLKIGGESTGKRSRVLKSKPQKLEFSTEEALRGWLHDNHVEIKSCTVKSMGVERILILKEAK